MTHLPFELKGRALPRIDPGLNPQKKKPAWSNTMQVFDHAGLLVNEPPATGELPFS